MSRPAVASRPALEPLRFPALAALGSVLAHDLVFAAQYGLGRDRDLALAATAHGYWPAFVALVLLIVVAGSGMAVAAAVRLRRVLAGLPPTGPATGDRPGYRREVGRLFPRLLAVVTLAFLLQENVEHLAAGEALPGLWALSAPGYPLAIPVIVLVTGLLALVGGWIRWQHESLVRRLVAARAALRRRPAGRTPDRGWALVAALLAHRRILLRRDAERAPPAHAAS